MNVVQLIEQRVVEIQGEPVLLDSDVAAFYDVETKHINQAVRNNPEKFPEGYILTPTEEEWEDLRSKFLTANRNKTRVVPKAFTEKGLYMLATILKSKKATQTTLAIIETFTRMRELGRGLQQLQRAKNDEEKQPILRRSGELIAEILENDLDPAESETTFELNLAVVKFKHTVKKDRKKK